MNDYSFFPCFFFFFFSFFLLFKFIFFLIKKDFYILSTTELYHHGVDGGFTMIIAIPLCLSPPLFQKRISAIFVVFPKLDV
jgi:hypothetical protein